MKLLAYPLISAALLAAASTGAAARRRIAGPYYVTYPYPYSTHRWGRWYDLCALGLLARLMGARATGRRYCRARLERAHADPTTCYKYARAN